MSEEQRRIYVIAGNHIQFVDYCRRSGLNPRSDAQLVIQEHQLMGLSQVMIHLVGTYYELDTWLLINARLNFLLENGQISCLADFGRKPIIIKSRGATMSDPLNCTHLFFQFKTKDGLFSIPAGSITGIIDNKEVGTCVITDGTEGSSVGGSTHIIPTTEPADVLTQRLNNLLAHGS
jgi:hypothetical protein